MPTATALLPSVVEEALLARDFVKLRDALKNWHPPDVVTLIRGLPVEDQAVVFRILPRKLAAETFGYLTQGQQEKLLKAMAQDEVTVLLNNMPDDDRTLLLEEMPAAATKQMLELLTPEERADAVKLLGYPEGSIGRLMTAHYVAVRENWTIQYALDYIREHGQDSETLSMIYVVDDQGVLIDDIRIRTLLLTPLTARIADVMDYRYVALEAAESQRSAVQVFRDQDLKALPVTDTTGVLIGIVTIDDVLDVAEAQATKEIQKIGGSEALDEPYMQIA